MKFHYLKILWARIYLVHCWILNPDFTIDFAKRVGMSGQTCIFTIQLKLLMRWGLSSTQIRQVFITSISNLNLDRYIIIKFLLFILIIIID